MTRRKMLTPAAQREIRVHIAHYARCVCHREATEQQLRQALVGIRDIMALKTREGYGPIAIFHRACNWELRTLARLSDLRRARG